MSYLTIQDLPEILIQDLVGSDYMLLSNIDNTHKITLDTLNETIFSLAGSTYQELTNKVIDNITNFVHANAIHFIAEAVQVIPKGTPVKLVTNPGLNTVFVDIATNDSDEIVGVCEDGLGANELGEIMVAGILTEYDTSAWNENDILYYQGGLVTTSPNSLISSQMIGFVFNSDITEGKILITNKSSSILAVNIAYDNAGTNLSATNAQAAITELDSDLGSINTRVTTIESTAIFNGNIIDGGTW